MAIAIKKRSLSQLLISTILMAVGAFIAAFAIEIFLFPAHIIDGGVIGVSMILGRLYGEKFIALYIVLLNIPFVILASIYIRRTFVIQMILAEFFFVLSLVACGNMPVFIGDPLEVIVAGGALLGFGAGLIIRSGSCADGTEILGIIINKKWGYTVGQVVLFINFFVFGAYGYLFEDWHIALRSLLMYVVAFKMMDLVITGLDELKSVMIISSKPQEVSDLILQELGLGLTVLYGRGGFSKTNREILMIVVERLDLAELKEIVIRVDPEAILTIQDLHEFVSGRSPRKVHPSKNQAKLNIL
ncbi:MAG: YitT family protein [Chlamydiia bacterium]